MIEVKYTIPEDECTDRYIEFDEYADLGRWIYMNFDDIDIREIN